MIYLVAFAVIIIDQLTKILVMNNITLYSSEPIIKGIFHLTYVQNTGAAFGIFPNGNLFFICLASLFTVGTVFYFAKNKITDKWMHIVFGMIIGGALGNVMDRLLYNAVIDFFDFRIINFAIFNVADSFIVIGCGLFIIKMMFFTKEDNNEQI